MLTSLAMFLAVGCSGPNRDAVGNVLTATESLSDPADASTILLIGLTEPGVDVLPAACAAELTLALRASSDARTGLLATALQQCPKQDADVDPLFTGALASLRAEADPQDIAVAELVLNATIAGVPDVAPRLAALDRQLALGLVSRAPLVDPDATRPVAVASTAGDAAPLEAAIRAAWNPLSRCDGGRLRARTVYLAHGPPDAVIVDPSSGCVEDVLQTIPWSGPVPAVFNVAFDPIWFSFPEAQPAHLDDEPAATPLAFTVTSGGDAANIEAVVKRSARSIDYCYRRALADAPTLAGHLDLTITIAPDGGVEAAAATSKLPAEVGQCLQGRFRRMQFARPASGSVKATIGFDFAP